MSAVLDPDTCTGTIAFDLTPDPTGGDPAPQTVVSGAASVAVTLPGLEPAEGVGGNKRAAEKNAALAMLAREVGGKYEG